MAFAKLISAPLNPGRISDHELAPSKVFEVSARDPEETSSSERCKTWSIDTSFNAATVSSIDNILKLPKAKAPMKETSSLTSTDSPFLDKLKERKAIGEQREKTKAARKVTKPKKTGTTKVSKTRARRRTGTCKVTKRGRISKERQSSTQATKQAVSDHSRCTMLLTVTAVVTVIVLFVDFLMVRMTSYGFSVMNAKSWMHISCVNIESDIPADTSRCVPLL